MIFDAHLHIIDPRFPLVANQGFTPGPFSIEDYRLRTTALGVVGGAVVAGSFQGFDQTWLEAALRELGACFVGVAQLPAETSDAEILRLDAAGVRALRANLHRRGGDPASIKRLAQRCHALAGWHTELYLNGDQLDDLREWLVSMPNVVIDHLGLTASAAPYLPGLAERGVGIKASGFGRLNFHPGPLLAKIHRANPDSLMFGTDLPGTRSLRPFQAADLPLISDSLADSDALRAVLFDNARRRYLARPTARRDQPSAGPPR